MARDFSNAREEARTAADAAVGDRLDAITQQAAQLEEIFDDLKLTDRATYDRLIQVVQDATARNESIASVIDRIKAFSAAGLNLAGKIGDIASGGTLATLRTALKL